MLEEIKKTAAFLEQATESFRPEVGIILGTGLGDFAEQIDTKYAIDYHDIPGFPVSTVEGTRVGLFSAWSKGTASWPCRAVSTTTRVTACSR